MQACVVGMVWYGMLWVPDQDIIKSPNRAVAGVLGRCWGGCYVISGVFLGYVGGRPFKFMRRQAGSEALHVLTLR